MLVGLALYPFIFFSNFNFRDIEERVQLTGSIGKPSPPLPEEPRLTTSYIFTIIFYNFKG